jgi:protein gp37
LQEVRRKTQPYLGFEATVFSVGRCAQAPRNKRSQQAEKSQQQGREGEIMGSNTKIEWTDASWTPIRARAKKTGKLGWHCEKVSGGCDICYSEKWNKGRFGTGLPFKPGHRKDVDIFLDEKMLFYPLHWKKPRKIFVCSMTDLFADFVPDEWIDKVFAVMALCSQHTFQVLTKRSKRMREYMRNADRVRECDISLACEKIDGLREHNLGGCESGWPLPNVWLGVSCEDQQRADERIPDLLATPAAVRFVSAEPLLAPIDFTYFTPAHSLFWAASTYTGNDGVERDDLFGRPVEGIDWIISGDESGHGARPGNIEWHRSIKNQCVEAGTAYFLKQFAVNGRKIHTPELDGQTWQQFPEVK